VTTTVVVVCGWVEGVGVIDGDPLMIEVTVEIDPLPVGAG